MERLFGGTVRRERSERLFGGTALRDRSEGLFGKTFGRTVLSEPVRGTVGRDPSERLFRETIGRDRSEGPLPGTLWGHSGYTQRAHKEHPEITQRLLRDYSENT